MKIITETLVNGSLVNKTQVTKEFAFVESIPTNIYGNAWLIKLDGSRVAPMYIETELIKQLKPGLLVIYETHYTHGQMGVAEKIKIVDIDKLERLYFS
jgi:hypothetical protein